MSSVKISVAELSKNVSEYLHLAKSGTVVEITSHGTVMAEINVPQSSTAGVVFIHEGNTDRLIEKAEKLKRVKVKGASLFDRLMQERDEDGG